MTTITTMTTIATTAEARYARNLLTSARSAMLAARRRIADGAGGMDSEQLDGLVNDLAANEGRVYLLTTVDGIMTRDDLTVPDAQAWASAYVLGVLAQGPDDRFSGRGNDVRRSRFEGIARAAQDIRYSVLGSK